MIEDFGEEILDLAGCPVWLVSETMPTFVQPFLWAKADWSRPFRFSVDPRFGLGVGGATLVSAIQIGYFMGIRKFVLYGVDHNFSFQPVKDAVGFRTATGEGNHFIPGYRSGRPWAPPLTAVIEESLIACDTTLRSHGGWVKNATRGGGLEVLERLSFDSVLSQLARIRDNGDRPADL